VNLTGNQGGIALGGTIARGVAFGGALQFARGTAEIKGGPSYPALPTKPNATDASKLSDLAVGQLGLFVDVFPDPTKGFHVGATLGLGFTGVTPEATGVATGGGNFAGSLFTGYDFYLGKDWSLGLMATLAAVASSGLQDSNRNDSGYHTLPLAIGVSIPITYY
jgi:hypothetical protein